MKELKELIKDNRIWFGKDGDGNYGYYGADGSLIPFSRKGNGTGIAILSKIQIHIIISLRNFLRRLLSASKNLMRMV